METVQERAPKLDITRIIEEYADLGVEIIKDGRPKGNIIANNNALKDFIRRETIENPEYASKGQKLSDLERRYDELCASSNIDTLTEAVAQVQADIANLNSKIREARHTIDENEKSYKVAIVKDSQLAQSCRMSIDTCETNIREHQSALITYEHFLKNLEAQVRLKKEDTTKKHI